MLKLDETGWSAVISDEFTFDNLKRLAAAVAVYLINNDQLGKPVIVGYDARFLSERSADLLVQVLEEAGASVMLTDRDVPLPVLEWMVKDHDAACGLMVTGGARPPQYSGLKVMPEASGPAIGRLMYFDKGSVAFKAGGKKVERFDPRERYGALLMAEADFDPVKKAGLKVVVDPMFGSARGYLDTFLQRTGCEVEEIHNYRDVLFGGRAPDPREENLSELKAKVAENRAALGFALSGDAGDFAVIDGNGRYFPASHFTGAGAPDSLRACLRIARQAAVCYNKHEVLTL